MLNTHILVGHPRRNIPRYQIWKADDIYECRACGKMYTALMTESHAKMCTKIEEFFATKQLDLLLEQNNVIIDV